MKRTVLDHLDMYTFAEELTIAMALDAYEEGRDLSVRWGFTL